jgi:hypothetical protein
MSILIYIPLQCEDSFFGHFNGIFASVSDVRGVFCMTVFHESFIFIFFLFICLLSLC